LETVKEGAVDGVAAALVFIVLVLVIAEGKRVGNEVGSM
jgi:cobalamin biosynthesis protein CobD/CbiB